MILAEKEFRIAFLWIWILNNYCFFNFPNIRSTPSRRLNRRNTSLVRCKKINRPEPCGQRQTGAMHDGSSRHGGLVPAGTALAGVTPVDGIVLPAAANRADKALRKPKPEQLSTASILCIVTSPKFLKSNRSSLCHNIVPLHLVTILSHGSCPIFRTVTRYGDLLS